MPVGLLVEAVERHLEVEVVHVGPGDEQEAPEQMDLEHQHGDKETAAESTGQDGAAAPDDPHFWLSPRTVSATLPALAAELARLDPGGASAYTANASVFADELEQLDSEITSQLKPYAGAKPNVCVSPADRLFPSQPGIRLSR